MRILLVALPLALIGAAATQPGSESARSQIVEEIHTKLQDQFNDLTDLDRGFGVTRIETNQITRHPVGNAGGYQVDGWTTGIQIFGNDGKRLDAAKIKSKFVRFGGGSAAKVVANPATEALKKLAKGEKEPFVWRRGDAVVEARFFRLTEKKCLGCHADMKLGDPVAIGIYRSVRMPDKVKP
ncbi:MAG TPA: hypothetical protein PLH94_14270 [Fimbriimonadaceae bacterium]|nr:hypothetical protein [Fimbriimonadaceae bacterium]